MESSKFLFFLIFLFNLPCFSASPSFNLHLDTLGLYFTEVEENSPDTNLYLNFNLKYKNKLKKNLGFLLNASLDYSPYEHSESSNFLVRAEDSGFFYKHKNFISGLGLLSHSFGLSQKFSPLNFIDTYSFWNPLDPKTFANPSIRLQYKNKHIRAFASYMPYRFKNIYPGNKSPWIPKQGPQSIVSEGDEYLLPDQPEFLFEEGQEIEDALKNNYVAGLRFKNKIFLTQFVYYRGLDTDPTVDLNIELDLLDATPGARVLQMKNPIGVVPVQQKITRMGFSLRYTLPFKWRLVYEGNLSKGDPNHRQGYRESHFQTLGLEWGLPLGDYLLVGVLQAYQSETSNSSGLGFVSPFKEAYLLGGNIKIKKLNLETGVLKSASLGVQVYTFKASYDLTKKMNLGLAWTSLDGEVNELISSILNRDHVALNFRYSLF